MASVLNLEKRTAATFCAGISRRVTRGSAGLGKVCKVYVEPRSCNHHGLVATQFERRFFLENVECWLFKLEHLRSGDRREQQPDAR